MNLTTCVPGIFVPGRVYSHPDQKRDAVFHGYRHAELELERWVDCHRAGYLFVPGDMRAETRETPWGESQTVFSHAKHLWYGTEWFHIDLDDDSIQTHDSAAITAIDPLVEDLCYAVCESVSSNVDGRFARWHGIVGLERPVITDHEFEALTWGLQRRLTTMTGAGRNPAQPCFGNARKDAYHYRPENIISAADMQTLIEEGYDLIGAPTGGEINARDISSEGIVHSSVRRGVLSETYDNIKPAKLRKFLSDYQVPLYSGNKTLKDGSRIYYLPCPFRASHTLKFQGATDSYIRAMPDGKWGFNCWHNSCQERIRKADKSGWQVLREAMSCPVRCGLKRIGIAPRQVRYDDRARVYDHVICPRNNAHRGTAMYRISDGACFFLCNEDGCPSVYWGEFLERHLYQGVAF